MSTIKWNQAQHLNPYLEDLGPAYLEEPIALVWRPWLTTLLLRHNGTFYNKGEGSSVQGPELSRGLIWDGIELPQERRTIPNLPTFCSILWPAFCNTNRESGERVRESRNYRWQMLVTSLNAWCSYAMVRKTRKEHIENGTEHENTVATWKMSVLWQKDLQNTKNSGRRVEVLKKQQQIFL